MKFLGQGGMESTMELKQQQGTDQPLSKALDNNNVYRCFVPIIPIGNNKYTVAAATVVGRSLSYDDLGYAFVLIEYEQDDLGQVHDITGLDKLSRISRVMLEGRYAREVAKEKREAEQTAKDMNQPVDAAALNQKLSELEFRFHGGKVNDKRIMPTEQPVVGQISVTGMTDLMIIKLKADGSPEDTYPQRVSLVLSSTKIKQFKTCLKSLTDADIERGYFECSFVYEGKDKTEAGRDAKFEYVPQDKWLQTMFPKWHESNAQEMKEKLLYDQLSIATKNKNVAFSPAPPDVFIAFKAWIQRQTAILPYIDTEQQIVKSAAADMLNYEPFQNYAKLRDALLSFTKEDEEDMVEETQPDTAISGEDLDTIAKSTDQIGAMDKVGEEVYDAASGGFNDEDLPSEL